MDTDATEVVRLQAQHLRLLQELGFDVVVVFLGLKLVDFVARAAMFNRGESACIDTSRREVERDIKAVTCLLGPLDKLVALVNVLFACLKVQSVQICLDLDVLGDRGHTRAAYLVCGVLLFLNRVELDNFERFYVGLLVHLLVAIVCLVSRSLVVLGLGATLALAVGRVLDKGVR